MFDIATMMNSPLVQQAKAAPFLRQVLAEVAAYGVPQQVIATLDDIAALLGFYDPLPQNQAAHLAGPIREFRSTPGALVIDRISDLEALVIKQRALLAFGAERPGHHVGTAEIVAAMGNTLRQTMPPSFEEVFIWAATDVLSQLLGATADAVRRLKEWVEIPDADVLRPGGKHHEVYLHITAHVRRYAIQSLRNDRHAPREQLRPLAERFVQAHLQGQAEATASGDQPLAELYAQSVRRIRSMYPDLKVPDPAGPALATAAD